MASYDVPAKYWEFAVKHACFILNCSPVKGLPVTPFEAVTGVKPDISNLVPFFCPGVQYITVLKKKGKQKLGHTKLSHADFSDSMNAAKTHISCFL